MSNSSSGSDSVGSSPLSQLYWDGALDGRLVLQQCGQCGQVRHYPRLLCDVCYSSDVEPLESSGRGTVHSWTICHHAFDQAFAADLPYVLLTVDMDEGVRVLGRLASAVETRVGLPVQIAFSADVDGRPEPVFTTADTHRTPRRLKKR